VSAPLLARRRLPLGAVATSLSGAYLWRAWQYPPFAAIDLAALVATYSWGAYGRRPRTGVAILALALWVAAAQAVSPIPFEPLDVGVLLIVFCGALLLGRSQQTQRAQAAALAQQSAERAVVAERSRFARELHDVVAHHVSVVVVQAAGARAALDEQPEAAREALRHIEDSGRAALGELRTLLGGLGGLAALGEDHTLGGGEGKRAPQPSVAELEGLLARMKASGLHVDVAREGSAAAVPASVGLAAYRIVQEALTNTLRHAPGASASIRLRYGPDAMEVEVTDDGARHSAGARREAPAPADGSRRGHEGIRERVALLGGVVEIGPRPSGYRVWARLPLGHGAS
jgi:signal transduction histidine kinase